MDTQSNENTAIPAEKVDEEVAVPAEQTVDGNRDIGQQSSISPAIAIPAEEKEIGFIKDMDAEYLVKIRTEKNGDPIVTIKMDGTVIIHKEGSDKEAAKIFYDSLQVEGRTLLHRIKLMDMVLKIYMDDETKVKKARNVIATEFAKDDGFRNGYVANIAMRVLHDQFGMPVDKANLAADKILRLMIEDKPI